MTTYTRDLESCGEFIADDGTILRELLNPDGADLAFRYGPAHAPGAGFSLEVSGNGFFPIRFVNVI